MATKVQLNTKVQPSLRTKLKKMAKKEGRLFGDFLEDILADFVKQPKSND